MLIRYASLLHTSLFFSLNGSSRVLKVFKSKFSPRRSSTQRRSPRALPGCAGLGARPCPVTSRSLLPIRGTGRETGRQETGVSCRVLVGTLFLLASLRSGISPQQQKSVLESPFPRRSGTLILAGFLSCLSCSKPAPPADPSPSSLRPCLPSSVLQDPKALGPLPSHSCGQ